MEGMKKFKCCECEHLWEVAYGLGRPTECPKCQSNNIHRDRQDRSHAKPGRFGQGRRRCRRMQV